MKKWEEQQKNKTHQTRLKNAKPAVSNTGLRKSGKLNKSLNDSKQISQIKSPIIQGATNENQNSISDYYDQEKHNLQSIPLYRILKLYNLQQYAKELISRGYGYDLKKFNYLNQQQLDTLMNEIRVIPGHKTKLVDLFDLISNEMIPEIENNSLWNMQSPNTGSGHYYNPTLSQSGKQMNKTNSTKIITGKSHNHTLGGRFPASTRNNSNPIKQQSNTSHNFQRKHSQPHVQNNQNIQSRQNNHMQNQGNQRQTKSHSSYNKKRSGQNIGYNYFIDTQDENDGYDEFQDAIENLVNQYNFANNRQIFNEKEYHHTEESFKNMTSNLEFDFELEQNIGYKNNTQMRAKIDKAVNQVNKQPPMKNQTHNSSGHSIGSQNSSHTQATKNTSYSKTASNQQATVLPSIVNQQKQSSAPSIQQPQIQQTQKQQTQQTTTSQVKNSSSSNLTSSSGISKPIQQSNITQTQASKETTQNKTATNTQSGVQTNNPKQIEKDLPQANKKLSQTQIKPLEEEKIKESDKTKLLELNKKLEIEKLKMKSQESNRTHVQTQKDFAHQLQQQGHHSQNQGGLIKKPRPQTAKYIRDLSFIQDDQCLIPEYDENDRIVLNYKENRLIKNLRKNVASKNDKNQDELNPQLDYDTIKHMYMSFDGGRLTSTIVNLDIEEMCFCFACAILKHIDRGEEIEKGVQNNKMYNNLHEIEEEHEDHLAREQNSSVKKNKEDYSSDNSASGNETSVPSHHQKNLHKDNQHQIQYNDISLNKTTNPIEEPTMIQDEYNQSLTNAEAERYLKDEDCEQGDRKFPTLEHKMDSNDHSWKQKKSLSDISERTHEISHQVNKSITVDQYNEQSVLKNNVSNINSRKQFEQSRNEMEEILKESLMMNARENQNKQENINEEQYNRDFYLTQDNDEDYVSHQDVSFKDASLQNISQKNQQTTEEQSQFAKQKNRRQNLDGFEQNYQEEQESFNQNFNEENYDEVQSEGDVENEYQDEDKEEIRNECQESAESQLNFSTISRYSMVIPNDDNSNKRLFEKTYNYKENSDQIFTQKPTKETIQNYCKNVCISCQLEKQIPIIALVYIERLLNNSGFYVTSKNWRKIVITSMIMASKIWDDESFENKNFSQAFPQFDVILINEMERVFLNFLDYNLYVKGADYAKYYFILREFAQKNKKSFPLRPLDLKTILFLQNNANKVQSNLREMYSNPLNKSF